MRSFLRFLGCILLVTGILLCLLGIASLPTGGLMFALAYVFFVPGVFLVIVGGKLLFFTRNRKASTA